MFSIFSNNGWKKVYYKSNGKNSYECNYSNYGVIHLITHLFFVKSLSA